MTTMVEKMAKAIAKAAVEQNPMLEYFDDNGVGYFDDYDNKNYDCIAIARAAIEAMLSPESMTAVRLRADSGEAFLQRQMDRAMMDERRRCLEIVRSIDPHNEAEANLIETIVRRMRGSE